MFNKRAKKLTDGAALCASPPPPDSDAHVAVFNAPFVTISLLQGAEFLRQLSASMGESRDPDSMIESELRPELSRIDSTLERAEKLGDQTLLSSLVRARGRACAVVRVERDDAQMSNTLDPVWNQDFMPLIVEDLGGCGCVQRRAEGCVCACLATHCAARAGCTSKSVTILSLARTRTTCWATPTWTSTCRNST
jgi:hypothetical protein